MSATLPSRRIVVGLVIMSAILAVLEGSGLAFWQGLVVNFAIFIILVQALNLASGFTGVFSLGHIGFMAIGAYTSAILTLPLATKAEYLPNLPGWLAGVHLDGMIGPFPIGFMLATLIAGAVVVVVASLVGAVLMRLSGHFVAVATLGFLVIVRVILFNADDITRGSRTFSNVTPYTNLWWAWGWAIITVYVAWRLKFSGYGRAMFAQKADRWAARSIGISILRPRLVGFVTGAFFMAVAGSLYAHFITSFSPTVFYFDLTFRVITMLVVGGMGSVSGAAIGTGVVLALAEALRRIEEATLLYGLGGILLATFFIAVIIFRPSGILGHDELTLERVMAWPPIRRLTGGRADPDESELGGPTAE